MGPIDTQTSPPMLSPLLPPGSASSFIYSNHRYLIKSICILTKIKTLSEKVSLGGILEDKGRRIVLTPLQSHPRSDCFICLLGKLTLAGNHLHFSLLRSCSPESCNLKQRTLIQSANWLNKLPPCPGIGWEMGWHSGGLRVVVWFQELHSLLEGAKHIRWR